jgi:dihydrofolate synthase/folylpolyglutamate synthase
MVELPNPQTLSGWLKHLESLHPKGIALGLERVAQVKQQLHLQPDFPIITVGGTNGKGSVCAMLEAIFHAAGYKVGCYTSPHLLHYNERVRISKQPVSDAELCAAFEKVEQVRGDISLTYFEFGTLAAMQLFIERKVDVTILEVGLGGRLDAVNVFDANCAIVTSVDIDHTDYLGDTREKIAFEKAGIFRKGRIAICADNDVPQTLRDHAQQIGAKLWCIGSEFGFSSSHSSSPEGQWNFRSPVGTRSALPLPALRGAYQLNNASAVLAALDALRERLPVAMQAVRRGLSEVQLAGRFQIVPGRPQWILDVAHNPHAARSLAGNLAALPESSHTYAVFAMLKDKDIASVVRAMNPHIDTWLVAGIDAPRGASSAELERIVVQQRVLGEILRFDDIAGAVRFACEAAGENGDCDSANGSLQSSGEPADLPLAGKLPRSGSLREQSPDTFSRTGHLRAPCRECRIVAFGSFYTVAEVMRVRGLSAP